MFLDTFWTNPESIKLFNTFLIILVIDSTYKAKKHICKKTTMVPLLQKVYTTTPKLQRYPIHRCNILKLKHSVIRKSNLMTIILENHGDKLCVTGFNSQQLHFSHFFEYIK